MNIYKFMNFSNEKISALYESKIWFSDRNNLNDPYESMLSPLNYSSTSLNDSQKKELNLHLLKAAHSAGSLIPILQLHCEHQSFGDDFKHLINMLSSNSLEINYEALDFLSSGNNYAIIEPIAKKLYQEISNKFLGQPISCFFQEDTSKKSKDFFLMWSHYADGFRGFALQFDKKSIFELNHDVAQPQMVEYSNERFSVDPLKLLYNGLISKSPCSEMQTLKKYRAFKFESWSYESEIRYFSNKMGLNDFNPKSLSRIIIGEKMPEWQQQVLLHLIEKKFPFVSVDLAKISQKTFDLDFTLLYEATPHAVTGGNGD